MSAPFYKSSLQYITAILALVGIIVILSSMGSKNAKKELSIAFYNVENLFDTIDDPHTNDNEFLPYNSKKWGAKKYHEKLLNISRVINGINNWQGPDIIGLCEVENRRVLQELLTETALANRGYAILHRNSPDPRGIDVALMYKPKNVKLLSYRYYPILSNGSRIRTREYLLASFLYKKDTLHLFVNHWSSRRGGQQRSEHKRINASKQVITKVDSLFNINSQAKVIVTGDFNDDPHNESMINLSQAGLINLKVKNKTNVGGSLKYQGKWNNFDQMLISESLMNDCNKVCYTSGSFSIYAPEWLLCKDTRYSGEEPLRTFKGKKYLGGYSDHLPVSINIQK